MPDRTKPSGMSVNRYIVRRVGEHHRGALVFHQRTEGRDVECIAAQHPMPAQQPQIAGLADRRPRRLIRHCIGRVVGVLFGRIVERSNPQIDIANLETRNLDAKIETEQREVLELFG